METAVLRSKQLSSKDKNSLAKIVGNRGASNKLGENYGTDSSRLVKSNDFNEKRRRHKFISSSRIKSLHPIIECPMPSTNSYTHILNIRSWKVRYAPLPLDILRVQNSHMNPALRKRLSLEKERIFVNNPHQQILTARCAANAFELIGSGIFMNRAAMKLAEIDATFNWNFSRTTPIRGFPFTNEPREPGILYFADICGGPGGFSEYLLWRRPYSSKGFGITLLNDRDDFRIECFHESFGAHTSFRAFYGRDGTGDILKIHNLLDFAYEVRRGTDGYGVHSSVADGGFCVEGQEDFQELLSKRLYLAQFICALLTLRSGGNFACKLFEHSTEFSMGLLMLMRMFFEKMTIYKPACSRPANGERYLVCENYLRGSVVDSSGSLDSYIETRLSETDEERFPASVDSFGPLEQIDNCLMHTIDYLLMVLHKCNRAPELHDFGAVIPRSLLINQREFFNHVVTSINKFGYRQLHTLTQITKSIRQGRPSTSHKHIHNKDTFLQAWRIPNRRRNNSSTPKNVQQPEDLLEKAFAQNTPKLLLRPLTEVYMNVCVPAFSWNHSFLVTTQDNNCAYLKYISEINPCKQWLKLDGITFVRNSVLIVDSVLISTNPGLMAHVVIDILMLNDNYVGHIPYLAKQTMIQKILTHRNGSCQHENESAEHILVPCLIYYNSLNLHLNSSAYPGTQFYLHLISPNLRTLSALTGFYTFDTESSAVHRLIEPGDHGQADCETLLIGADSINIADSFDSSERVQQVFEWPPLDSKNWVCVCADSLGSVFGRAASGAIVFSASSNRLSQQIQNNNDDDEEEDDDDEEEEQSTQHIESPNSESSAFVSDDSDLSRESGNTSI